MATATVVFMETGLDAIIAEVDRISKPSFRTIAALRTVHKAAYADTQVRVHAPGNPGSPNYVPTGSLRNSGRTSTTFDGDTFVGEITYGGPSPGFPNDPVEYAIYEMARGGEHDFLGGLTAFHEAYLEALATQFKNPKKGAK